MNSEVWAKQHLLPIHPALPDLQGALQRAMEDPMKLPCWHPDAPQLFGPLAEGFFHAAGDLAVANMAAAAVNVTTMQTEMDIAGVCCLASHHCIGGSR